jgi:hypothetical protein
MGAALTYARRYALFTLVGIAGEDDLDAPDLNLKIEPTSAVAHAFATDRQGRSLASDEAARAASMRREATARSTKTTLDSDRSAALRERLIAELAGLRSADEAADWVHTNLPVKNTLTTDDADLVEASFRERLAAIAFESVVSEGLLVDAPPENAVAQHLSAESGDPFFVSVLESPLAPNALATKISGRRVATKAIRLRDKEHCKFVTAQPCVICGRTPSEAHHLRFAQPRALGRKVSDEYTVPVCRLHHRELHRYGDEASWWAAINVDPLPIALDLWRRSRASQNQAPNFPPNTALPARATDKIDGNAAIAKGTDFGQKIATKATTVA